MRKLLSLLYTIIAINCICLPVSHAQINPRCLIINSNEICTPTKFNLNDQTNPCVAMAHPNSIPDMNIITYCDSTCSNVVQCDYTCLSEDYYGSPNIPTEYYNTNPITTTGIIWASGSQDPSIPYCKSCPENATCSFSDQTWDRGAFYDEQGRKYNLYKNTYECNTGTFFMNGKCNLCPAGHYCPPSGGQPYCPDFSDCKVGDKKDETGLTDFTCLNDTTKNTNNGSCTCPNNATCDEMGNATCNASYYQDTTQTVFTCAECPTGYYCPGDTNNKISCPAGRYCNASESKATGTGPVSAGYYSTGGGTSATPTASGNGCLMNYDCGIIAAGYFATGCGTAKEPNTNGNCNSSVYYSGPVAPGHYSTGGGTLYSPSKAGSGCLNGYECGAIGAGYYSTGGGTDVNGTCLNSHSCGTIAGGYYATCGAMKAQPTNSDASQCVSGCECGGVSAGYYSTGAGTSATPTESGNGCLAGFKCGPCTAGKACGWATTTPSDCNAGYYCPAATEKQPCPAGTTSDAGTGSINGCFISEDTNFCINGTNCFNLPNNTKIFYK